MIGMSLQWERVKSPNSSQFVARSVGQSLVDDKSRRQINFTLSESRSVFTMFWLVVEVEALSIGELEEKVLRMMR